MDKTHADSTSKHSQHSPELRIVLIGGRELRGDPSNKSAAGNLLLGTSVFDTNRRTVKSVAKQEVTHGRQVTVVDTPGWWWHYPLGNTTELDQIEIKNSVHLCTPGPHAFLLVIPLGIVFPRIFKPSLEEHMKLFHEGVFHHTIVLFTVNSPCDNERVEYEISGWPALQWTVEQCGNRKHVLNINDRQDSTQVEMLFKKIEAMVAENTGHYCVDNADGSALREKMEALVKRASQRVTDVQAKRRKLRALIEGGKTPPAHLRIVMVGAQWSAKSSAGNTILRKDVFEVRHRRTTEYCEIGHSIVADRKLTVVDSPGWFYNQSLKDTSEMDKLEIESSMHQCPPGPHAVLLVVGLASAFNASYQRAVREHMSLFTDEVWKYTLVLFTRGDWLGGRTVEERIESEEGLQWLVDKCGNMYHVLDNTNHDNNTQVTELLEKIEEMWAGNKNPHFEVDMSCAEAIEARKEADGKSAKRIAQMTQRQASILREVFRGERKQITHLRVVLIGGKESGKSMAGNKILFEELFNTAWIKKEFQVQRRTTHCVKHQRNVAGVYVSVVEAPGFLTETVTPDWVKTEVFHSVSMCAPGPHAFLLVIPIYKTFTEKDCRAMVELLMPFGERVWRHCMVLFTWGDWLNHRTIEEYIVAEGKDLKWLVEKCGNRYHVLRCNRFYDSQPVKELFQKTVDIITRTKGHYILAEDKKLKPVLQVNQPLLTEEEWSRREQELIDRMLKAATQEMEVPVPPHGKMAGSIDGAFIPSMGEDVPSEAGCQTWHQMTREKVSEWLRSRLWSSDMTSGVGSMCTSASCVEKMDESPLTDGNHQQTWFLPKETKILSNTVFYNMVSKGTAETPRRYSL